MTVLLAGDIGGTKTILRLVETVPSTSGVTLKPLHEQRYPSASFPDLVPMVRQFLAEAAQASSLPTAPQKACFAIAGPVVDNTSQLTNLCWTLSAQRLSQELDIPQTSLINDFAAVGYGVVCLTSDDLLTLQAGKPNPQAPIGVIGAGNRFRAGLFNPSGG
jgi:glucokinase